MDLSPPPGAPLRPLPYHMAVRDLLRRDEPEVWRFFSSATARAEHLDAARIELLKSNYRLDEASHPALHAATRTAAQRLGITDPVTLYQAHGDSRERNAGVFSVPGEAHVIFSGGLLDLLEEGELTALLGHELAHHALWNHDGGSISVADRMLHAATADPMAEAVHVETARLYRLATEVFADRGAWTACGDLATTVAVLVKTATGLRHVSGAGYLRQAREVLGAQAAGSGGDSHPEHFIRARALELWVQDGDGADDAVWQLLVGQRRLDHADVTFQEEVRDLTSAVIGAVIAHPWMRTDPVLGHARQFFDHLPQPPPAQRLAIAADTLGSSTGDYIVYVLLDFATVDPDLEDLAVVTAQRVADLLRLGRQFDRLLVKETGVRAAEVRALRGRAAELLATAERGA